MVLHNIGMRARVSRPSMGGWGYCDLCSRPHSCRKLTFVEPEGGACSLLAAHPGLDDRDRRDRISSGHSVSIERPPLGLDRASTWQAASTHVHSAGFNAADKARAHSLPCNKRAESLTDSAPCDYVNPDFPYITYDSWYSSNSVYNTYSKK